MELLRTRDNPEYKVFYVFFIIFVALNEKVK